MQRGKGNRRGEALNNVKNLSLNSLSPRPGEVPGKDDTNRIGPDRLKELLLRHGDVRCCSSGERRGVEEEAMTDRQ